MKKGNRLSENAMWIIMMIIGLGFLIAAMYVAVKGIGNQSSNMIAAALVFIGGTLIILPLFYN